MAATTTTQPTGRILAYGKESGWVGRDHAGEGDNLPGNIVWWERRNWGEVSPEVKLVMSYGGTVISEDATEEYWFTVRPRPFTVQDVSCLAECTTTLETSMPAGIRSRLIAAGYTPPDS